MNINYHVHTPLCNHATGTMSDYIRQAVSLGLTEICFLDHLTLNPADRGLTMTPEEVPLYYQAARQLGHEFRNDITVKVGLEIDFHPGFTGLFHGIVGRFDFDVIGSSIHYLGNLDIVTRKCDWRQGKGDTDAVYRLYFELMDRMLDHDYFDVVCHFDLLKKFGRRAIGSFSKELDAILSKIKARGLSLEVNTSGYDHPVGEAYPSPEILKKCRKLDIPVTIGSDAHRPNKLRNHYDKTEAQLLAAGYSHLRTFTRRRPGRIPLNGSL